MVDFIAMLSHRKGDGCTYRPEAGTRCLISPPHCDDNKGYVYHEYDVLWAEISINNKNKFLGYFECEIEAAKTYDAKAMELRGEFARTNKMMGLLDG